MLADCRAAGVSLHVLAFPDETTFRTGRSPLFDGLRDSPELHGLEVIDMAGAYRARGARFRDIAFDGIGHLNAHGHFLTAQLLDELLSARLRPCRSAELGGEELERRGEAP
jgi:hypothetical protein